MHSPFAFLLIIIASFQFIAGSIVKIPLVRHKSIRQQALGLKNLENFGIETELLDPHFKPKPKPPGNDSVALYRYLDSEFYGIVRIGHKAQAFNMVFDTAWGNSWVISEDCSTYNLACFVHNKYDHTKSSRYKPNGEPFIVNEGTYNITGYLSIDDFNIGHSNVSQQTFAEITYLPNLFALEKADGVVGFALKSLANGINPVFYNMIQQGLIKKPIFSIYLNRDKSSNDGGDIILGGIEQRHVLKNHTWTELDVVKSGYWQFKMDRVTMDDGKKSYPFCLNGCQAIADTSSNSIVGPYNDMLKINKLIKSKLIAYGYYRVPCDTVHKLPKLIFTIKGVNFELEGRDYIQRMGINFVTLCISALQPTAGKKDDQLWFLGGAFLAEYYSYYNLETNKMGFVKAA